MSSTPPPTPRSSPPGGDRYPDANIGGRIPESMFMIDIDPYHGGLDTLAELEQRHGPLPDTLTDFSGRGDGGAHYFFRRPPGRLIGTRLGAGIDLKTSTGYGVLPPSIHPDTGKPYTRIERPVAAPPAWLIALLRPEPPQDPTAETAADCHDFGVRRSPTSSAPTHPGPRSRAARLAHASMLIPTPTVPAGCIPPRRRRARPPSATAVYSSGRPTPCSRSPSRRNPRATRSSRRSPCSITAATCPPPPAHSKGVA